MKAGRSGRCRLQVLCRRKGDRESIDNDFATLMTGSFTRRKTGNGPERYWYIAKML